jgi:tetratricopeptide (TPR) repeat protein
MYWAREIEVVYPEGLSKRYTYLLCDSFEEFAEDTAGVVSAPGVWDAQIGKLSKAEARARAAAEGTKPLDWKLNPHLSPNVISVMNDLGAVISATVVNNLYGTGDESEMREFRELIINRKVGQKFHIAATYIPGYESIFDGTINKKSRETAPVHGDYAYAYCDIGLAYRENHDYGMAIKNFSQAIEIDPNYAIAYYHRGGNYCMKGEFDNAIEDLTQALRIDPTFTAAKELLQRVQDSRKMDQLR